MDSEVPNGEDFLCQVHQVQMAPIVAKISLHQNLYPCTVGLNGRGLSSGAHGILSPTRPILLLP